MTLRLICISVLALSHAAWASGQRFEGRLRERGTKTPLAGISVFLIPKGDQKPLKATTAKDGSFAVDEVPEGQVQVVVNQSGYLKLEIYEDISAASSASGPREFYLERNSYQLYETTIVGSEDRQEDARRTLKASEFINLPGSGSGDPLKGLQNLPGVNRPAPFQSQVIIQGSSPRDTRYTIDGQEVPIIFHFGGLSSVVLPEAIDRVDYLSAGFGPEFGRAIGGLVGVWTREPRRDRMHGFAFVDLLNAGGLIEGPAGEKSSYLFGLRQSYIGPLLKAAFSGNKDFNLTVAPSFGDLVGIYQTEVTPIDRFRLVTAGSRDSLEFLLPQPVDLDPSIRGNFSTSTSFFRIIPEWTHIHDAATQSRLLLGFGKDFIKFDTNDSYFNARVLQLTARGEVDHRASDFWSTQIGLDHRVSWADVDVLTRSTFAEGGVLNPISSGSVRQQSVSNSYTALGAYWRNEIRPGSGSEWTVLPSLREDYFAQTKEAITLPRVGLRFKPAGIAAYRVAGGLYTQTPEPQETDPVFGNPDLKAPRAWHVSAGADLDFREGSSRGFAWSPGVFYKRFERLVVPSTTVVNRNGALSPENFNNSGEGKAYGFETLLKMDLSPWKGWLSYTLSRSTRQNSRQPEYPFVYDQTHLLTAIASLDLGRGWQLGGRFRYATGNPITPITGSTFDADNDVYLPQRGALYSERVAPFYQLDLRVDKRWIYDTWILSLYLDLQNVTGRKNIEAVQYSYDYSTRVDVSGLPTIPTLGLKAEF